MFASSIVSMFIDVQYVSMPFTRDRHRNPRSSLCRYGTRIQLYTCARTMPAPLSPSTAEKHRSTRCWLPMSIGNATSSLRGYSSLWIAYLARMWSECSQSDLSTKFYLSRESMCVHPRPDACQCIDFAVTIHPTRFTSRGITDYHRTGSWSPSNAVGEMCQIYSCIADHVHTIDTFGQFISSDGHTPIRSTFLVVALFDIIVIIEIGSIAVDNEKLRKIQKNRSVRVIVIFRRFQRNVDIRWISFYSNKEFYTYQEVNTLAFAWHNSETESLVDDYSMSMPRRSFWPSKARRTERNRSRVISYHCSLL